MGLFKDIDEADSKYYFNMETNSVERGMVSDANHRMGPYDTEAEAQEALARAKARNEEWEEDDKKWNG